MMETFLQIWGGVGYFFAKVLLVRAEFVADGRKLRLSGWSLYLLGLPAWVILLVSKQKNIKDAKCKNDNPGSFCGKEKSRRKRRGIRIRNRNKIDILQNMVYHGGKSLEVCGKWK
jgi:hypothetical protein